MLLNIKIAWPDDRSIDRIAHQCNQCHQLKHHRSPRLEGQPLRYFQHHRSINHPLWVHQLSDACWQSIAIFYHYTPLSFAPPMQEPRDRKEFLLYRWGDRTRHIPACSACHGVMGEGSAWGPPVLSGQKMQWMIDQWKKKTLHKSSAWPLTTQELEQLFRYLSVSATHES